MAARNELDNHYSRPSLDGMMQPETSERTFSDPVQNGIVQVDANQGSELVERLVCIEGVR